MHELSEFELEQYEALGHLPPFHLLDPHEVEAVDRCGERFVREIDERSLERGIRCKREYWEHIDDRLPWVKSAHVHAAEIRAIAHRPEIVERLAGIIGDDIVLWGAQWIRKGPGEMHRWHVDVETLEWASVNVWIGLTNVSRASGLKLMPGTHLLEPAQFVAKRDGFSPMDDVAIADAAARLSGVRREVVTLDVASGDAVIFHGRQWHGSRNETDQWRSALLLQYSPATADVRIPITFDDPVRWHPVAPPCICVKAPAVPSLADDDGGHLHGRLRPFRRSD